MDTFIHNQNNYADDFSQIPGSLVNNQKLQRKMISLIGSQEVMGKSTQGKDRADALREILRELTLGTINIHQAIRRVGADLPRVSSPYAASNRVFARGWEERLVRTQFSRFYNEAVLVILQEGGHLECFVPLSTSQGHDTKCSREIAGRTHPVAELLANLRRAYAEGEFSPSKRIPEHPHCTHVVHPVS